MFTITITKTTTEECPAGQEWKILGKDDDGEEVRGYTPEIIKKKEVELRVYEQTVESLNIKAVINAVNATK